MSATFNPQRRNRNIGTSKQGHSKPSKLVIPALVSSSPKWSQRLGEYDAVKRTLYDREIIFITELTFGGCNHACSVDDILHVLSFVPQSHWSGLNTFVLRQPTRKEHMISPAWGRLFYSTTFGKHGRNAVVDGPAITLEAMNWQKPVVWSTSLSPSEVLELDRLRSDGHSIQRTGNKHVVSMSKESIRATQLFRTLLHEIGHWLDWLQKVDEPSKQGGNFDELCVQYFQRPRDEREAFAHRYAEQMRLKLEAIGAIPFKPLV